jgi:hypothetical protein
MTEHDVLARAAKALRSAHPGEHPGSGFTRARIMTSLHQSRRGRLYRWIIGAPLVSVLLVGSAWAQSSGKWPAVWAAVTSVFSPLPKASEPTLAERHTGGTRAETVAPAAPPPAEAVAPPSLPDEDAPALARDPAPRAPTPRAQPLRPRVSRRSASPAPASTGNAVESASERAEPESQASTAEPEITTERSVDPEIARFRAAHELHFQGSHPSASIAAYGAYLREFPRGRFVPEARYNMALDYIKLGDKEKARRALRPFADGLYGDYRKHEAQELLEALR